MRQTLDALVLASGGAEPVFASRTLLVTALTPTDPTRVSAAACRCWLRGAGRGTPGRSKASPSRESRGETRRGSPPARRGGEGAGAPARAAPLRDTPPPPRSRPAGRCIRHVRAAGRPAGARPAPPLTRLRAQAGGPARRAPPRQSRGPRASPYCGGGRGGGQRGGRGSGAPRARGVPRRGGGAQMATQVEALLPGAPLLAAEERALVLKPPQDGGREKGESSMGPDGGPGAPRPPSAKQQKEESNNQEKESLLRAGGEAEDGGEAGGAGRREFIEAPPPKVNPWTKNAPAAAPAVNGQSPPGGCPGLGARPGLQGGSVAPPTAPRPAAPCGTAWGRRRACGLPGSGAAAGEAARGEAVGVCEAGGCRWK